MTFLGLKMRMVMRFLFAKKALIFVLLLVLPLVYLFLVFYFYAFNSQAPAAEQSRKNSIDRDLYYRVTEDLRQRELNSARELNRIYIDPFGR